jgi:hypothetical protein
MHAHEQQTLLNPDMWHQYVRRVHDDVVRRNLRIYDVEAVISDRFGISPSCEAYSHGDVAGDLAAYFKQRPTVDRVLYECRFGPATFEMAGLNRDAAGKWWLHGVDAPTLALFRSNGTLDVDGTVPDPALYLSQRHGLSWGDNPRQIRLILLTLTATERGPLSENLLGHLDNAVPLPHPQAAPPPDQRVTAALPPPVHALLLALTGGGMPHVAPASADAQVTIQQTNYEWVYTPGRHQGCPATALSNHLGVVVPMSMMLRQAEGGNLITDLIDLAQRIYHVPVMSSDYGLNGASPQLLRNDLDQLLADETVDRITYQDSFTPIGMPTADGMPDVGSHFATLTRNDQGKWELHDRGDILDGHAARHRFLLRQTPGGPVLLLGSAADVREFLLARFEDPSPGFGRLEWFASTNIGRHLIEANQMTYLIDAANQRPQIQWSPQTISESPPSGNTERTIYGFLRLLGNEYDRRRLETNDQSRRTVLDYEESVVADTARRFDTHLHDNPHKHQESQFQTSEQLARNREAWTSCTIDFLNNLNEPLGTRRKAGLNQYFQYLLNGELRSYSR